MCRSNPKTLFPPHHPKTEPRAYDIIHFWPHSPIMLIIIMIIILIILITLFKKGDTYYHIDNLKVPLKYKLC